MAASEPSPFERFKALTKRVITVPKTEIDKRAKQRPPRPLKKDAPRDGR